MKSTSSILLSSYLVLASLAAVCTLLKVAQAAPATMTNADTIQIVTNNRCNKDRTIKYTGTYGTVLMDTTTVQAHTSFTQYVKKDQESLAWIIGDPSQGATTFDEMEASMKDGVFFYDVSFIQSYTGQAFHVRPIMAQGKDYNEHCAIIGCDANASMATCPNVYWTDHDGNPDYACQYTEVQGFEINLC